MSSKKHFKNNIMEKCVKCSFFPHEKVMESDYTIDKNGVKHCYTKFVCLYDLHIITPNSKCPRYSK